MTLPASRSGLGIKTLLATSIIALAAHAVTAAELINAASPKYGAKVSVSGLAPQAVVNQDTPASSIIDGNLRTRTVVTGVPYTFTIELLDKLPIEKVAFANGPHERETSPKDVTLTFDDGSSIDFALDRKLPERNRPVWQELPVGKASATIRLTVKSIHPAELNWGGLAEFAVYTSEDLSAKMVVPDFQPDKPAFVNAPKVSTDDAAPTVTLPPQVKPGEHPRSYITKSEIEQQKKDLQTDQGQAASRVLTDNANAAIARPLVFPDPKGPLSQLTNRGDDVMKAHESLSSSAGNLGRAYALTGDEKYAVRAAEILRGYAARYADYPDHKGVNGKDTGKISAQRLSEAMWLIPLAMSYDLIHDSPALTDADHKAIREKLLIAAVEFIYRKPFKQIAAERDAQRRDWRTVAAPKARGNVGNWLLVYNAAAMTIGATLDDQDMIDVAVADLRQLIVNGIGDDGMWNEGAIGYQYFAMAGMLPSLEIAARRGIDLWSFDNAKLKRLYDMPRFYAYPDGSMPGINDSARVRGVGWQGMPYDHAFARYGDRRYTSIINTSPRQLHFSQGVYMPTLYFTHLDEPAKVNYPSMLFHSLGYAIARDEHRYALLDFGQHGGVHGHYDKLNLILFGADDEAGGEPRFRRYEDPLHLEYCVQTIAHNTMAVDGQSQNANTGALLAYDVSGPVKIMRGESTGAYPGVVLDRTIVFTADAIFDVFTGASSRHRTWDRTLRYRGELDRLSAFERGKPLGTSNGYQHIFTRDPVSIADGWQGVWKYEKGSISASIAGMPGQQVFLGKDVDNASLAILRQQGTKASFGVLYAFNAPASLLSAIETGLPTLAGYESKRGDGSVDRIFVSAKPGAWSAVGVRSDASVLHIKIIDGKPITFAFTGGTFARLGDVEVKLATAGNAYATVQNGQATVVQTWSPTPSNETPSPR